jgi:GAF domain-containing protein
MISRADVQRGVLDAVDRAVNAEPTAEAALARAVELLHDRFDHYSWVGIYLAENGHLVLGPWKGPQATEHVRIRVGDGICGAAAASGQSEVVDDVGVDPRYLACFPTTRSEIVVPILAGSGSQRVVGEIDIDSDLPAAFDVEDRRFLEHVARMLSTRLS